MPLNSDVGTNEFSVSVSDGTLTITATLQIEVANTNDTPGFSSDPIILVATEDAAFSGQLVGSDPDAADTLTFSKTAGPAWLGVSTDGSLSGTPANSDVGGNVFTVRITDAGGLFSDAQLQIDVTNTNDTPVFTLPTIAAADATQDAAYSGTVGGSATDPDTGDNLTYSKSSGPSWLAISSNGTLSGTPESGDVGSNTFTLRATDTEGLFAETTLLVHVISANPDANSNGILDSWETGKFGNADPGAHPPDADPDGDGLSNLLEFALNTHPTEPNASPLTHDFVTIGPDKHLRLTIPKNPLATNLSYLVETCGTLNDWSATNTQIETDTAGQLIVRDTIAVSSASRRFIRLKVRTTP